MSVHAKLEQVEAIKDVYPLKFKDLQEGLLYEGSDKEIYIKLPMYNSTNCLCLLDQYDMQLVQILTKNAQQIQFRPRPDLRLVFGE